MRLKYMVQTGLCLVFLSVCLCGCDRNDKWEEFITALDAESTEYVKDARELLAENTEAAILQSAAVLEAEEREEAYREILENCTREFIGHHVPDETFFAWVEAEYGAACIDRLLEETRLARPDQNIWYELTGNSIHVLWLMYCEKTGFQQYQLENVAWKECASEERATFAFTGDINFAEGYVTTKHMDASSNGIYDCFSEDLLELMNRMDVMMLNNEFTYSERGEALKGKAYTFRASPTRADLLEVFGTDIVSLANNHVYDYGPDALLDTIATLDERSIPHVGAGANIKEAEKPFSFICNGRKITIVAATQIERSLNYTKEATEDDPGVLKTLNPDRFVNVIRRAKKNSDYVIAVVHWGTEGDSNYGKDQYDLAQAFASAGADAIIGGHTHCLQGFDMVEDVPVIYSLGNFWFSKNTQDTGIAQVTIEADGELTLGFIPCIQKDVRTSLVTEEAEKERIFDFMRSHSAPGVTLDEMGILKREE